MHGNSGSVTNSIATFQDNESCHLLMRKTNKKIKQGFSWLFYSALLRLIQMLMHSLSSFKCGSGLDKVISDCCIWVQEFRIECSGTICGNHLWISVTPQGMPVLRTVLLFDFLRWLWCFHDSVIKIAGTCGEAEGAGSQGPPGSEVLSGPDGMLLFWSGPASSCGLRAGCLPFPDASHLLPDIRNRGSWHWDYFYQHVVIIMGQIEPSVKAL